MTLRVFIQLLAVLLLSITAFGQGSRQSSSSAAPASGSRLPEEGAQEINLPDEMRSRLLIERLEGEHKKFIEDVIKLDELSSEVIRSFVERKRLVADDMKRLGNIEKLAKRILSHAGGSQTDDNKDTAAKLPLPEAIEKMSEAVASIKKIAMSETRHVVSAALIGSSNELIELTRVIRRSQKQSN